MADRIQFTAALNRYRTERLGRVAQVAQQVFAKKLGTLLVRHCPVRTGLARGNMRLALGNTVGAGVLRRLDPTGVLATADILNVAARAAGYSRLTFYNNVPYMSHLENGWSLQAPQGVFRITLRQCLDERSQLTREIHKELGGRFVVR